MIVGSTVRTPLPNQAIGTRPELSFEADLHACPTFTTSTKSRLSYELHSLLPLVLGPRPRNRRWLPLLPIPDQIYYRLPSSFSSDIESGFTSSNFDLTSNVAVGDSRSGLDQQGKREIQKIMKSRKIGFDEARRIVTEQRFAKNGIRPDGRPEDPKFVSFS